MDLDVEVCQLAPEPRGAELLNDLAMGSHAESDSTFCAYHKHKLSLDPLSAHWQLHRMSIGKRIEGARKSKGWSQTRLAEQVGAAQTTISSWERGRTEPTREDVQRIADALDLNAAELELAGQSPAEKRQVRKVGYVGAGAEAHFYAGADDPNEFVDAPEGANDNTVAVEVRGVSLGPAFDRWLAYYDDLRSPVTPDLHGRLCVVATDLDQVLVKILRPSGTPDRYHLISNSGEEPIFDQKVIWAARVTDLKAR